MDQYILNFDLLNEINKRVIEIIGDRYLCEQYGQNYNDPNSTDLKINLLEEILKNE